APPPTGSKSRPALWARHAPNNMDASRPALNPPPARGGRAGMGASRSRRVLPRPVHALLALALAMPQAEARTVYRCVRDGTVSLATAPEPGSKCEARQIDDNAVP